MHCCVEKTINLQKLWTFCVFFQLHAWWDAKTRVLATMLWVHIMKNSHVEYTNPVQNSVVGEVTGPNGSNCFCFGKWVWYICLIGFWAFACNYRLLLLSAFNYHEWKLIFIQWVMYYRLVPAYKWMFLWPHTTIEGK